MPESKRLVDCFSEILISKDAESRHPKKTLGFQEITSPVYRYASFYVTNFAKVKDFGVMA
jgi:hypothetical protein